MEGALSRLRKNAMLLDQPRVGLWYSCMKTQMSIPRVECLSQLG